MANSLQRPSMTLNISPANTEAQLNAHRVLLIGEIGDSSKLEVDKIYKSFNNTMLDDVGKESELYTAIKTFKDINTITLLDVLPIEQGSDTSSCDITVNDTASKDSKLILKLNGVFVELGVKSGEDNITIATNIETVLKDSEDFTNKFTITRSDNVVTLETKLKSATLNDNLFTIEDLYNSGCNATANRFSGGISKTLADDYLKGINPDERYHSIIFDYANGTNAVRVYLEANFNLTNEIKDGVGLTTVRATQSDYIDIVSDENYASLVIFGNLQEMEYNVGSLNATSEIVAIRALRLTDGANVSQYVAQNLETFGGMSFCSMPYFNTLLSFDSPNGCIEESDLINIIKAGGTVWTNNGNTVLSEVVTTYKTNKIGEIDPSFKYLNYVDTMSTIREYFVTSLRKRYSQVRLTDGDLLPNYAMTNKGAIKASLVKYYNDLADKAITRKGYSKWFEKTVIITDDLELGKISFTAKTPIVTQLRAIDGNLIEVLDINATI